MSVLKLSFTVTKTMVFVLLMSMASVLLAQQEGDQSDTDQSKPSNSSGAPNSQTINKDSNTQSKPKPAERVFKPSEEISEDSPVPFPVDI